MEDQICDSCYQAVLDVDYEVEWEDAIESARELGRELPDHSCETWEYGGQPCACSCHPR